MQGGKYDFSELLIKALAAIGQAVSTLVVSIFVIYVLVVGLLSPILLQPKPGYYSTTCLSNMKQLGLSLMMYAQDYDERFPTAQGFHLDRSGRALPARWGMTYHVAEGVDRVAIPGLVSLYVRKNDMFRCPSIPQAKPLIPFLSPPPAPERETCMYNDFAVMEKLDTFTNPANTILLADGEDIERNVGHAWDSNLSPQEAAFDGKGRAMPGRGATVQNAPTRHQGKASYGFADGHCKLLKPEEIFFPPRASAAISHKGDAPGPDPAGKMVYQNRQYKATFHLK